MKAEIVALSKTVGSLFDTQNKTLDHVEVKSSFNIWLKYPVTTLLLPGHCGGFVGRPERALRQPAGGGRPSLENEQGHDSVSYLGTTEDLPSPQHYLLK